MTTPALLVGVTLLFWGWQTGHWIAGALMALVLEGSRLAKEKWQFTNDDFNRIWNVCMVLVVGGAIYAFAVNDGVSAVTGFIGARSFTARGQSMTQGALAALKFITWLPMFFAPFLAAQAYSQSGKSEFRPFSLWLRRRARLAGTEAAKEPPRGGINVAYPFFGVCLISASAANRRDGPWFYVGLCLLMAWVLWFHRPRRFAAPTWAVLVLVVAGLGYLGQAGLFRLQKLVERLDTFLISGLGRGGFDPKGSRTSMGEMGKLKLSGRIVLRLGIPDRQPVPSLLRETCYNLYKAPIWYGSKRDFQTVDPSVDEQTWVLRPATQPVSSVTVAAYLRGGRGLLPLPHHTARIENLPAGVMETNRFDTVKVDGAPGLVIYDARYGAKAVTDAPPDPRDDFDVPAAEEPALVQVLSELNLARLPRKQVLERVENFFQQNFEYSTWRKTSARQTDTNLTALGAFLLKDRAGHCEYFATATVLLLRKAGIQARYAAGYSVQETAGKGKFVVRDRHAHAWAQYWDDDTKTWNDFDTTPASWLAAESGNASMFELLSDGWSRMWFEFSKWRWGRSDVKRYLVWVLAGALVLMLVRLIYKGQWRRSKNSVRSTIPAPMFPGLDSEFYLIEKKLVEAGLVRRPAETFSNWLDRIEASQSVPTEPLHSLLLLHNRYRFDPHGITAEERLSLRADAERWLRSVKNEGDNNVRTA